MNGVCARARGRECVHSLKGNASFDFLLITQHALCSVVNCPGPLFLSVGNGGWNGAKTLPPPLRTVCLLIYSLTPHLPYLSYVTFAPPGCKLNVWYHLLSAPVKRKTCIIFLLFARGRATPV